MNNVSPKLFIDFATAVLDPRVTITRAANTATAVNNIGQVSTVNADLPRFDYDPITLVCKGLLVEESRANLFVYSDQFNQAIWGKTNASVTQDAVTSPAGTLTGDKLIENAASAVHRITQSPASTSAITYAFSIYAKAGERGFIQLRDVNAGLGVWFNLSTGLVGTQNAGITGLIQPLNDGWYRCVAIRTTAVNNVTWGVCVADADGSNIYQGDGTSGIYIWGAQLEAGAFATSYIPTTSAAVTRNADVATITGTNFSDFWQTSKGGVLVRARPGTVSGVRPWLQFDDGTANEIIALRGNTTNPELYIVDGGTPQAQIDAGTISANTDYSLTGWWATNDCKARLDSGAVVTDTSATIPTVTQARLGSDGTNYLNGHLASISYYDSFSEQIYTRRKNKAVFNLM